MYGLVKVGSSLLCTLISLFKMKMRVDLFDYCGSWHPMHLIFYVAG